MLIASYGGDVNFNVSSGSQMLYLSTTLTPVIHFVAANANLSGRLHVSASTTKPTAAFWPTVRERSMRIRGAAPRLVHWRRLMCRQA